MIVQCLDNRIMNSCNQIFLPLNFFSPEVLGKALRFMLSPRSKTYGGKKKNPFYNLKLLQKSSRKIRWKVIQKIINSYLKLQPLKF